MKEKHDKINRRQFIKTIGAAGVGSVFASVGAKAGPNKPGTPAKSQKQKLPQVPRRKLGKTDIEVPILSMGGGRITPILLRKTLQWGVNYWDLAYSYGNGNSERKIGKFLSENPAVRKNVFIVSKASKTKGSFGGEEDADIEQRLQESLKRMNTSYIDLYYGFHGLTGPVYLTDKLKQWVQSAKKRKLIRFFGFSTHQNVAQCLNAAAKLDWIDAIMISYNFRLMQDAELQTAIDACHKAGIGLIAMKTQGRKVKDETEEDKKLVKHFMQSGLTDGQAKIKLVLEDKRFSSACVGMKNVAILDSNVAAVLDKTKLTRADRDVFSEHAAETCSGYCAGCAHICDSALPDAPYVSDVMRYLMYYNSYGEQARAKELFAKIPGKVKNKLLSIDYSSAEARCPQRMPIGELVAEAVSKLA